MSNRAAVLLVALVAGLPTFAAASPAGRCSSSKLKASAIAARALARCHSDAAARGVFLDNACAGAALSRIDTLFTASEAVGGCATTNDHGSMRTTVEVAINDLVALVRPGLEASVCASQKLRAIGSELFAILAAHANDARSANASRLAAAIARADARFTSTFARIAQHATCMDLGDGATVRAHLDRPIATLRGRLVPKCGDDVVAGSEACDGADSAASACPGRCRADCTCRPIVCGDGLREGSEACDGSDDAACPGRCQSDCRCASSCGDGIINGTDQCDGADAAVCTAAFLQCQAPGLSGECQCCTTGFCNGGFPSTCCGSNVRCVRNAQSPVGVCAPFTCSQASDCGIGHYNCENGNCCAQPERSCINIGCCAGSTCTWASGVPLCCIPSGGPCTSPHVQGICCSGSCNTSTGLCD